MEAEKEILVEVKGLSKKFSRSLKRSMMYGFQDLARVLFGRSRKSSVLRKDEFWAVKDINFTLRRGECLGLIGRNGAGKSTLLKMLNGLIPPDEGSITMRGQVGALIELGAGFNPLLTGRENIYINGQLLGFTKTQINDKMEAILAFAEIGEFIDSPVQNYSSGMKVRLGFAIAAQMEPDVLIIDEVLAVGDLGFILKCFSVMDTLMAKTAVIFVSHSMPQVSRICSSIMLLEKGQSGFYGSDVSAGIDQYYAKFGSGDQGELKFSRDGKVVLEKFRLGDSTEGAITQGYALNRLDALKLTVELKVHKSITTPFLSIAVFDKEQRPIGVIHNEASIEQSCIVRSEEDYNFYVTSATVPRINLSKGLYSFSLSVTEKFRAQPVLRIQTVCKFQVYSHADVWPPIEFETEWK